MGGATEEAAHPDLKGDRGGGTAPAGVRSAMTTDDVVINRKRYDQAFMLLDEVRAAVLALLRSVTQRHADRRPAVEEWSMGEIVDHLAITERAYMAGVADLAANATPHEFAYGEVVRTREFRVEDLGEVAVTGKFPTPPHLMPSRGKALAELERALNDARSYSRQIMTPYRDQDLDSKFFLHPKIGPMTLYERMANIAYHERKHVHQIERTLRRMAE